jgi:hypothetical protein
MNSAERIQRIKDKIKEQKTAAEAKAKPITVPTREGFINTSALTRAFTIIICIVLAMIAAFIAYKFLLPFVIRGGKRFLRYSK